jgi:hypothetical protein|tara:strand:+ start:412 stop:897 length:486 start_codon:yes stop_codon:yes gene_type:complete
LINSDWSSNATALVSAGTISSSHAVTPEVIDIRSITANKASRVDLGRYPATIVVFEDSQNIEYPTIHYDIRNETYTFTLHIRVLHDERSGFDSSYGKDRLRAIYLILRRVLEGSRKGYTASDGSKFNQLFVGSRSESNDRAKKLFGYKVSLEAKRFNLSIP